MLDPIFLTFWSGSSAGYAIGIPTGERTATAGVRLYEEPGH